MEDKQFTKIYFGAVLIGFDIFLNIIDYNNCKNSIGINICSFTGYQYGIFGIIGKHILGIVGIILLILYFKNKEKIVLQNKKQLPRKKEVNTANQISKQHQQKYIDNKAINNSKNNQNNIISYEDDGLIPRG